MKRTNIKRRPLSDTVLANLEPELKEYRELDGDGLYFRVKPNGYPCEMNVNGNKLIAHDIASLAENIKKLLSSAFFGQKVRELMETISN